MSKVKAITIGGFIWILGTSFYTASYFFPILENLEIQENLVLAIALIPISWLGTKIYYRKGTTMHGFKVGIIVLLTAISLDAIITVPYFIIPYGGSYQSFFGTPVFWLIAIELFLSVYGYWLVMVRQQVKLPTKK